MSHAFERLGIQKQLSLTVPVQFLIRLHSSEGLTGAGARRLPHMAVGRRPSPEGLSMRCVNASPKGDKPREGWKPPRAV